MKTFRILTIASLLALPAGAIEAPDDNAPPPSVPRNSDQPAERSESEDAQPAEPQIAPREAPRQISQPGYLGIDTADISEALASHLNLPPGQGLIVRDVKPDGPAAKAGVIVNDVITGVSGQKIGSRLELSRQISSRKPGETLEIGLIRHGQPSKVNVTLGERPEGLANSERPRIEQPRSGRLPRRNHSLDGLHFDGVSKDFADRVRGMIEGNMEEFDRSGDQLDIPPQIERPLREMAERMERMMSEGGIHAPKARRFREQRGDELPPQFEKPLREMTQRMERLFGEGGIQTERGEVHSQGIEGNSSFGSSFSIMDNDGSVEIKSNNGSTKVTVRDQNNQVTWSGPWNTDQDKAAAPENIRRRLDKIHFSVTPNNMGFRMRSGENPRKNRTEDESFE